MKHLIGLSALIVLFAMTSVAGSQDQEKKKLQIGDVVKDMSYTTVDGKEGKLSDFRNDKKGKGGKLVLITFWSYQCPSGRGAMSTNDKLAKFCKDKDIVFLPVSSYGESKDQVKKYCSDNEISYTVAYDTNQEITKVLGAKVVTTSAILDKDGKLVYLGGLKGRDPKTNKRINYVTKALKELLASKEVSTPTTLARG